MSEEKIQLQNVNNLSNLKDVDFSGGYACDMETGICGPVEEVNKNEQTEETKNENKDLV